MTTAEKYECYSVYFARVQKKLPPAAIAAMVQEGLGCVITPAAVLNIARISAKALRIKVPKVYIKNCRTGRAGFRGKIGTVTIPHYVLHDKKVTSAYRVAYIAHEIAHLHKSAVGHRAGFKRVERRVLKHFGLGIRYRKAYARQLYALKDGRVLYDDGRTQGPDLSQPQIDAMAAAAIVRLKVEPDPIDMELPKVVVA